MLLQLIWKKTLKPDIARVKKLILGDIGKYSVVQKDSWNIFSYIYYLIQKKNTFEISKLMSQLLFIQKKLQPSGVGSDVEAQARGVPDWNGHISSGTVLRWKEVKSGPKSIYSYITVIQRTVCNRLGQLCYSRRVHEEISSKESTICIILM